MLPLSEAKAPEIGKSEQEVRLPLLFQQCKYSLQVLSVSADRTHTATPILRLLCDKVLPSCLLLCTYVTGLHNQQATPLVTGQGSCVPLPRSCQALLA